MFTTEKDYVRRGARKSALPVSVPIQTVPLRVEIEDEGAAMQWLIERLQAVTALPTL